MADVGIIVKISKSSENYYVFNNYIYIGLILPPEQVTFEVIVEQWKIAVDNRRLTHWITDEHIAEANYKQFCNIVEKSRSEWLDDPRFAEWSNRYKIWKIGKLFEK